MENSDDSPFLRAALEQVAAELEAYYAELNGESPRAAAILAMASIEDELERLIRRKFPHEISNKLWKRICGPGLTPFGTFKAKADVAQAFGYYGPKTRKLLETLAAIRNKFAHSSKPRSFLDDDILSKCREIEFLDLPRIVVDKPTENDVRYIYTITAQTLHLEFERIARGIDERGESKPLP